jgi:glycosyltransferase involved in cell wall biosynthesis
MGVPEEALVVGRVGQPIVYKWSPLLFTAFERIARAIPQAWLVVVGAPPIAVRQIQTLEARARVVVVPKVDTDVELLAVYSAMDVTGHAAAQGESFGYVIAESMLCELPVVTLSTPWGDNAQTELVRHGANGYIARGQRAFTEGLRSLLLSEPTRAAFGRSGRADVITRFDSVTVAALSLTAWHGGSGAEDAGDTQRLRPFAEFMHLRPVEWLLPKVADGAWRWVPGVMTSRLQNQRPTR